jgi:hypothetical protein
MGMSRHTLVIFTFGATLLVVGVAWVTVSGVPASSLVGAVWLVLLGALVGRVSCSFLTLFESAAEIKS